MNKATQVIFSQVGKEIQLKNYDKAYDLLRNTVENDVYIQRARYLLHCDKNSPYYDESKAKSNLDKLDGFSDSWGKAEKGRCLLFGELYPKNTVKAEDLFTSLLKKEPKAAYFTAYLNEKKLHKDEAGLSFGSEEYALKLYAELSAFKNSYREHAKIACCRLQLKKDFLSISERASIYGILSEQLESKTRGHIHSEATKLMSEFLLDELSSVVEITYDEKKAPTQVLEKISFQDNFRSSQSSILSLKKRLIDDNI